VTDKAPEAFRTISEVAEQLDVPQHVLRFWETRFSQIRPMKRGGGRRYYRPEDVDLLKGIRTLLYGEGYTIRGAQKILKENGVAHVVGIGRGEIAVEAGDGGAPQAPASRQRRSRPSPSVMPSSLKAQAGHRPGWCMS
jgi:DNA-binding transcriptional MerR regulator